MLKLYRNGINLFRLFVGIDEAILSIMPKSNVAYDSSVTLTCRSNGYPSPSYTWYKDNVLINETNCPTLIFSSITFDDHGYYHCISTNSYGSSRSEQQLINVWSKKENS